MCISATNRGEEKMNKQASKRMLGAITRVRVAMMAARLAFVAALSWAAPAAALDAGAPRIAPPVSHAYGRTLTEWLDAYFRWYAGTAQDPAQSVVGRVQLLPVPAGE